MMTPLFVEMTLKHSWCTLQMVWRLKSNQKQLFNQKWPQCFPLTINQLAVFQFKSIRLHFIDFLVLQLHFSLLLLCMSVKCIELTEQWPLQPMKTVWLLVKSVSLLLFLSLCGFFGQSICFYFFVYVLYVTTYELEHKCVYKLTFGMGAHITHIR